MNTHIPSTHELPTYLASWGPFLLASRTPIDAQRLTAGDADAWKAVEVQLDPEPFGCDPEHMAAYLEELVEVVATMAGETVRMDARAVAEQILAEGSWARLGEPGHSRSADHGVSQRPAGDVVRGVIERLYGMPPRG